MSQDGARWFPRPHPSPGAQLRLICFPHGGGGASAYSEWIPLLPEGIELRMVQLPGREERRHEPPLDDLALVLDALEAILPGCVEPPFAFFGHCVGARIAFELARRLRRSGAPEPAHLFLSGHAGPGGGRFPGPLVHLLPDDELVDRLWSAGTIPADILRNQRFIRRFLPLIRADARLTEAAEYAPEPPLGLPISALGGLSDPTVTRGGLEAWRSQTTAAFALHMLPGDHFYLRAQRASVIEAIADDLVPWLGPGPEGKADRTRSEHVYPSPR